MQEIPFTKSQEVEAYISVVRTICLCTQNIGVCRYTALTTCHGTISNLIRTKTKLHKKESILYHKKLTGSS
jgi:hypothetical protein